MTMLNETRIYRNSPYQIGLIILVFAVVGVGLLASFDPSEYLYLIPLVGFFGLILSFILYWLTAKTTLSDSGISSQTFLGTRSLAWNEISRISGRGNAIKLHNSFGDVTVAPTPQLPGYVEVVNWIGLKRPDLFSPLEYHEMSRSLLSTLFFPLVGVLFIGYGYFIFTQTDGFFYPLLMFTIIGIVFIGMMVNLPQAVSIQGRSIQVRYLFSQKTLSAAEIGSVDLRYTQTRNGKSFFVALSLLNKKVVRISGLSPSLPVVYLVLRNWHKANAASGLTNLPN